MASLSELLAMAKNSIFNQTPIVSRNPNPSGPLDTFKVNRDKVAEAGLGVGGVAEAETGLLSELLSRFGKKLSPEIAEQVLKQHGAKLEQYFTRNEGPVVGTLEELKNGIPTKKLLDWLGY